MFVAEAVRGDTMVVSSQLNDAADLSEQKLYRTKPRNLSKLVICWLQTSKLNHTYSVRPYLPQVSPRPDNEAGTRRLSPGRCSTGGGDSAPSRYRYCEPRCEGVVIGN